MPVLGTKLHLPTLRSRLVDRRRLLLGMLAAHETRPRLVLVAAPAGFGKTTALSQWLASLARTDTSVAWLALDASDAEITRFLAHLVAAAQTAIPEVGVQALAALEAGGATSVEPALVSFINDLDALAGPTVLALDDYHVIDGLAVHEAMTFLVDNLPPQVTLAIASRSDPLLPLARLRARGELIELRAADLRFTPEESERFLTDVMGLELEPAAVAALGARTEGWAAGLQLAALSARTHQASGPEHVAAFVEAFSGSNRFVLDYLLEEVVDRQPHEVRRFLLSTSVVERLTGGLADVLTGRSDGQSMLESLERDNVFLVPLDEERRWYRYHHLFADALRARLHAEDPAVVAELHRRAGGWLAEHGLQADAVNHSIAGGDHERTADLVELGLRDLRRRRSTHTLRKWLDAIPEDVARRRPLLATQMGWARLTEGDLEGVERWLAIAEAALDADALDATAPHTLGDADENDAEIRSLPAMIAIYRASVAQARGDVKDTMVQARLAHTLAEPADHSGRGAAAGFLGLATWADGHLATAIDTFGEAIDSLRAAGMIADALGGTVVLADMWMAQGRPIEARRLCERTIEMAASDDAALPTAGDLHVALAQVLCAQGDLDSAAARLGVARELGEVGSFAENRHRWFTAMAALRRAHGDFDGAVDMLDRAEGLFLPGFFPDVRPIAATRTRVHLAQGRVDAARSWAAARNVTPADRPNYSIEYEQLTLARLVLAEGDTDTAIRVAGGVITDAEAAHRHGSLIEARIVRALAHHARGDADSAVADLGAAVADGVPAGLVRVFLDEGQPMLELLGRIIVDGPQEVRHLAERLLALERGTTAPAGVRQFGPAGLSERELEVLRLLATDLSGPEIARALFVSVNTLRTHTKRIFTKLDVNTRRAAVGRAQALGLL